MPSLLGGWTEGSCNPSGRALPRPPLLSTDGGKLADPQGSADSVTPGHKARTRVRDPPRQRNSEWLKTVTFRCFTFRYGTNTETASAGGLG